MSGIKTEMEVSASAAVNTARLIHDYLAKGGMGLDADALSQMLTALEEADRIVILPLVADKP